MHDEDVGLDDIDDDAERAEEARKLKEVSYVHLACCLFVLCLVVGVFALYHC